MGNRKNLNLPINIVISGVTGLMGAEIIKACKNNSKFKVTGGLSRKSREILEIDQEDEIITINPSDPPSRSSKQLQPVDLIIDFSEPSFSIKALNIALTKRVPILIGTTGHSEDQVKEIEKASSLIPILLTANTSIGIALIKKMLSSSKDLLGIFEYKEITEIHHKHKKDSPSGTALELSRFLQSLSRKDEVISIESIREGNSTGEHSIILGRGGANSSKDGEEYIVVTHKAKNRRIFADGALLAAEWLRDQRKGIYSISDFYLP